MSTMSKSSKRWIASHNKDFYVKKAKETGFRSRAAYKLLEIQQKDQLIKPGMVVVDLGAAPGGWSQVAASYVGEKGKVIAIDQRMMPEIPGVTFIQGDFCDERVWNILLDIVGIEQADLVISDLAPNISGNKIVDQSRSEQLAELSLELSTQLLKPGGCFLVKVFQGTAFENILQQTRKYFTSVVIRKPKASRAQSKEAYLVGKGYNHKYE